MKDVIKQLEDAGKFKLAAQLHSVLGKKRYTQKSYETRIAKAAKKVLDLATDLSKTIPDAPTAKRKGKKHLKETNPKVQDILRAALDMV